VSEHVFDYLGAERIARRVAELGAEIEASLLPDHPEPLVLVSVLKGSFIFAADLCRNINAPVHMAFLGVASYGRSTRSSGAVRLTHDLTFDITGRDVLVVEDIVDTGLTMDYLLANLRARKPRRLRVCTLLHKPAREKVHVPLDYVGFTIDDVFVVGYGLDYDQRYRNLRSIHRLQLDSGEAE
jgi:hypoxanthine phosphoribosyltransferase